MNLDHGRKFDGSQTRGWRQSLLVWYDRNRRDLPWRSDRDPYRVWLSEIMLQQTRVAAVLEHYHRFLQRFPTVQKLASARESSVLAAWSGLGYYRRARMMHAAAKVIVKKHGGKFPGEVAELRTLPGIGRYTAGAIRAFAFREDAPILDTNVMRVLHRVFVGRGDPKKQKSALWNLSEALIPKGKGYDFNQALMDFGAMVCTARDPYCLLCPMKDFCKTYPFTAR